MDGLTQILTTRRSKTEAARDLMRDANVALYRANEVNSNWVARRLIDNAEHLLRRASELLLFGDMSLRAAELADELTSDDWIRTLQDVVSGVWSLHDELCAAVAGEHERKVA